MQTLVFNPCTLTLTLTLTVTLTLTLTLTLTAQRDVPTVEGVARIVLAGARPGIIRGRSAAAPIECGDHIG